MSRLLHPPHFRPLPLGQIRPEGWLRNQLLIQAQGLSGHLDEFWPDVRDSQWFGGDAEAWERAPYWLDGVVPLAYMIDDPDLRARVNRHVDYILSHQEEDGWLGPRTMVAAGGRPASLHYDLWAQMLITKVLTQYGDATGDRRAALAVEANLRMLDRQIDRAPLFNWAQFRWFEALIAIYWLYEQNNQNWLLDLAVKLQAQGFDWDSFFQRWPLTEPTPKGRWNYAGHVVNNAMAIKAAGLWWRLTGEQADRAAAYRLIELLDRYHGMATGVFTGDECIAGRQPIHGTELCAVVEYAYSLQILLSTLGDPAFGDQLEKIVFNALPATFSSDMWAHQYDQQANQIECSVREDRIWNTNGPEANIFGLEPNYGCCTANLSQGWPKFAAHLWMRAADGGLVAAAYAPSRLELTVEGVPVTVRLETDYPFRDRLDLTVTSSGPVHMPLYLRLPAWTDRPVLSVHGAEPIYPQPGTFCRLDREWQGETRLTLHLPMPLVLSRRMNDAAAIERGPLVYALRIGEEWRRINGDEPHRELPHADWEVYPTTAWNIALDLDNEPVSDRMTVTEHPMGDTPFSPDGAPVSIAVPGRLLPTWQAEHGSAADVPPSPVTSTEPLETWTLIPYGCTHLRITEFPVLHQP